MQVLRRKKRKRKKLRGENPNDEKITILMSDFNFESNGEIKQGGGHSTIPTKNILKIKKIKI